jgi:GNAT superfamily N-acetyltransferase
MTCHFNIISKQEIDIILPFIKLLNPRQPDENVLLARIREMATYPHYECVGAYHESKLIGISGLWFCTRHYSGRSVEPDHVIIDESYRNQGIGKMMFAWIYDYALSKGYETIELNTYVNNSRSHKFYYNEGFRILGFHFLKEL